MICVSVQEHSLDACKAILKESPMAEIRADLCGLPVEETVKLIASHDNLIFTCRIAETSVGYAREQMLAAIKHGVKYIDIEIEAPLEYAEPVALYAKENGTKLIISYHNYVQTPSYSELKQMTDACLRRGADIAKIVTTANDIADVTSVMKLYRDYDASHLVAFAMGECGKFSRYLSLRAGAPYTYVSYGKGMEKEGVHGGQTAPGQYTKAELEALVAKKRVRLGYGLKKCEVEIPCSKSVAQRAIVASLFAKGKSVLKNYEPCNDINGAVERVSGLGGAVSYGDNGELIIESEGAEMVCRKFRQNKSAFKDGVMEFDIGESGLLTRLMLPFAAYLTSESGGKESVRITGHGSILGRNLKGAAEAVSSLGLDCRVWQNSAGEGAYLPFVISGRMKRLDSIKIDGSESSQTVSGFLMMLPLLPYGTELIVTNPASVPYIELTINVLKRFSIEIGQRWRGNDLVFTINGGEHYKAASLYLEPDWSSASFFAVIYAIASMRECRAGKSGRDYRLLNMPLESSQADKAILEILEHSGVELKYERRGSLYDIRIESPAELKAFAFDASNAPDLFPVAALYATFCNGISEIKGVGRLLQKESNRAESIYAEYTALGADIEISGDYMYIRGGALHGGAVNSHNDHRIAMSLVAASLFVDEPVEIDDLKCIDKSFPSFLSKL